MTAFAELVAATNFSFLRGASHAQEMVGQAAELGLAAIGIADRNTLAGVVRAHHGGQGAQHPAAGRRAPRHDRRLRGGLLSDRPRRLRPAVPPAHAGQPPRHQGPVPFLLRGDARGERGPDLHRHAAAAAHAGLRRAPARTLAAAARGRVYLAATFAYAATSAGGWASSASLPRQTRAPLVATNDALYHHPGRKPLADVLACIREKCTIAEAGYRLEANAERHLKRGGRDGAPVRAHTRTPSRARSRSPSRIRFDLEELRYEYPDEPVPPGKTPQAYLEELTWAHAARRYPDGVPDKVRALLDKELALIARLDYARYFLTVYDVVRFARAQDKRSCARAAARPPTARCATASASPASIPPRSTCCSSASSRPSAASRPTSTSTSSTSGARR